MAVVIRRASGTDAPYILDITYEAFTKYANELRRLHPDLPEGKVAALSETRETILDELRFKTVYIAFADGIPVGSIRYETIGKTAYISRFGVKLYGQANGVGRALVDIVVEDCIKKGITAIALHTASKMTALIRFYYGRGFYVHSTSNDRGYIRVLLVKELSKESPDLSKVMNK